MEYYYYFYDINLKPHTMEISSNSFGLFTEFSFWVEGMLENGDSVPVTLKRPPRIVGEYKVPNDSDVIIVVDEDNECEVPLTEKEKEDVIIFVKNEISNGKITLPCSVEYNTFNFKDEKYFDIR
jgi:hypothetical protein